MAAATGYSQSQRDPCKYVTAFQLGELFYLFTVSPPNICFTCIDIAKDYPHAMELNVLVIGMPNVGKSTLLNALRNMGIKGRM